MAALSLIHGGDIYSPHPVPEGERLLDFSANLNPLGMPEEIRQALCAHVGEYAAYPDPLCRSLRQALAEHHRLCPEWFLCGNGAADLIFRLAFGTRPKRALIPAPTFAEYAQALTAAGCETIRYVLSEQQDFLLDERFLKAVQPGIDLVFVCNPNNPTGLITQRGLLERLLERCEQVGARLCVDECFLDFLPEEPLLTVLPLLEKHPNLLVLRAFTKLYAMAGIRLGYGVCSDPQLLSAMARTGQPWSVSTVASVCGIAALGCREHVRRTLKAVPENRAYLKEQLERLGLRVLPGQANYLCFYTTDTKLGEKLEQQGVLIRDCRNYPGLCPGWFRIAVRPMEENQRLIVLLHRLLSSGEESR